MQSRVENKESLVESKEYNETNFSGMAIGKRRYTESNLFEDYTLVLMDMYVIGKMSLQSHIVSLEEVTPKEKKKNNLNEKKKNNNSSDQVKYPNIEKSIKSTNMSMIIEDKDENEKNASLLDNFARGFDGKSNEKGLFMNAVYYPSNRANYTKLNSLMLINNEKGALVNVIGVCVDIEDPISIKRNNQPQQQYTLYGGSSSSMRSSLLKFWLMDNTNVRVCVAVWGIRAYEMDIKRGTIYCINRAHLKFYNEPIINVLSDGAINPIADTYTSWSLVNEIRDWWINMAEKSKNTNKK
jgi:hypothetical protein